MPQNLHGRSFLKLLDFSGEELRFLLGLGASLKEAKMTGTERPLLKGKTIALIFEKDSTRMGEPEDVWAERIALLSAYSVTQKVKDQTGNPHAKFLDCLDETYPYMRRNRAAPDAQDLNQVTSSKGHHDQDSAGQNRQRPRALRNHRS